MGPKGTARGHLYQYINKIKHLPSRKTLSGRQDIFSCKNTTSTRLRPYLGKDILELHLNY